MLHTLHTHHHHRHTNTPPKLLDSLSSFKAMYHYYHHQTTSKHGGLASYNSSLCSVVLARQQLFWGDFHVYFVFVWIVKRNESEPLFFQCYFSWQTGECWLLKLTEQRERAQEKVTSEDTLRKREMIICSAVAVLFMCKKPGSTIRAAVVLVVLVLLFFQTSLAITCILQVYNK